MPTTPTASDSKIRFALPGVREDQAASRALGIPTAARQCLH